MNTQQKVMIAIGIILCIIGVVGLIAGSGKGQSGSNFSSILITVGVVNICMAFFKIFKK